MSYDTQKRILANKFQQNVGETHPHKDAKNIKNDDDEVRVTVKEEQQRLIQKEMRRTQALQKEIMKARE